MRRLICPFVVRIWQKQVFSWCGSYKALFTARSSLFLLTQFVWIVKQVAQRATIAQLSPMCQGQISFQKIWTHPSFNACSCYMKVSKGSNQKQQRKSGNTIFPIISLWGYFLDAQGQLTPQSVVRSRRNSNSFIILCMSLIPATLKKKSDQYQQILSDDIGCLDAQGQLTP